MTEDFIEDAQEDKEKYFKEEDEYFMKEDKEN